MKLLAILFGVRTTLAAGLDAVGGGTANPIWAQVCTMLPYCNVGGVNPLGPGGLGKLSIITAIVSNFILWTIGPAAVIVIIYASIRLITSSGNDETVRKAWKEIILYAVLGLIFALLADTIINFLYALIAGIVEVGRVVY